MARSITLDRESTQTSFGIARREDVNYDDVKKRWAEKADKMDLPRDPRTQEEIQMAEDFSGAASFAEFFEYEDVEISESNATEAMVMMAEGMESVSEEEIKLANEIRDKIIEEDAAEKINQVLEFVVNEDDPLLMNDFKEKSEKLVQKWSIEESKKDGTYDTSKESTTSNTYATSDPWNSMNSTNNSRTATVTSSKTTTSSAGTSTVHVGDDKQRNEEVYKVFTNGRDNMLAFVHNGKKKEKAKSTPNMRQYGGKKKFSPKNIWSAAKRWLGSQDAKLLCKVGVALCFEIGLGLITKRLEFDGPGQMLGYLGMMLGIFYIGSELYSEGFDMRRIGII